MFAARFTLIFLVSFLVACTGKPVKTYEGEVRAESELAILTAGENIEVKSIDGKRMKTYLLSNIETKYALAPGKHKVVFNYTSVWAVANTGPDGDRSELVESAPHVVEIEVLAGSQLRFDFPDVDNVREAKAFAENFSADVIDEKGQVLAAAILYDEQKERKQAEHLASAKASADSSASSTAGLAPMEAMKVLWEAASADEKKAFLKWAFQ